ncbi:retron St85 family effector protein [Parvibaculum sp.]|uniref:retron St85 family effector protein n=1 Tax=uncultured Parvibaculum sp. TaxID=291828 RepID=UPI0026013D50|nr:retron St85 family effector protein [Parvibaculum sp.]
MHAPTSVIFLCGGEVGDTGLPPKSLRDALVRISHRSVLAKYDVRCAEEMEWALPVGEYLELLEFEADIAQISDLIILFSESEGSIAELGAFSVIDEIARRMLVFVDHKNYADTSFISLGPLGFLTRKHGDEYVSVLQLQDLGIEDIKKPGDIDLDAFLKATDGPIKFRLSEKVEPTTFDGTRNGHITKLITGLVQYYAALTLDEIETLLFCMGIPKTPQEIKKHLNCAELFEWVQKEKRGITTYYAAIEGGNALYFELRPEYRSIDRVRWRSDVLNYWRHNDAERFASIQVALRKAKS